MTKRDQPATKPLTPKPETEELRKASRGMTRKGFGDLIKRALNPPASKPVSKT